MRHAVTSSREALGRLALLGGSAVFALLAGEGLLRVAGFEYRPLDVQASDAGDRRAHHAFEEGHFVFDPELIWAPRRGVSVFNAQGFRGPLLDGRKDAGELRIFTVGDSNTLGWAGTDGANWPAALQEKLARQGRRAVVVNAGVWGYSSFQGLRRLRQCLRHQPDLLLVSFGSNDGHAVGVRDRDFAARHSPEGARIGGLARWRLGQLWMTLRDRWSGPERASTTRVPLADYRRNLTTMIEEARRQGARVVLLTRPFVGESLTPDWWKVRGPDYNAATVEVAVAERVPVIDLYTHFKSREDLFADESHFTAAGHRLASAIIARELQPYLD